MPVTKAQFKATALSFPEALEKSSYGRPAIFIAKKFFTRLRDEDNALVIRVESIAQRDMMLELDPATYFITDHYKDYSAILVRLAKISPAELKIMLTREWRRIAPKKLVRETDAAFPPPHAGEVPSKRSTVRQRGDSIKAAAPSRAARDLPRKRGRKSLSKPKQ